MLSFVQVPVGEGPLMACRHCGGHSEARFAPFSDIAVALNAAAAACGPRHNVILGGPEPLKHPALPALLDAAARSGADRIGLYTDARGLAVGGNADGVVGAGVRHLHVPLLAGESVAHDERIGSPGAFAGAVAGIDAFFRAADRIDVSVALCGVLPVCVHNVEVLPEAVRAFARAGACLVRLVPGANAPSNGLALRWVESAFETGIVNGVWVSAESFGVDDSLCTGLSACSPIAFASGVPL